MISIIIASVDEVMLAEVTENITETIGLPFEILSYSNSKGEAGLCSIYNKGSKAAKYKILCFMHEDLHIKTDNWGKVVVDAFQDQKLGIIGVVGSSYKTCAPTGWYTISYENKVLHGNYIQSFKYSNRPSEHFNENPLNQKMAPVVSVDGMWFCTTKALSEEFPFDEEVFKGFHCYDLDFCFQVGQAYKIAVNYQILIEHYSEGNFNKIWWLDTLKLHQKWRNKLPISVTDITAKQRFLIEKRSYRWVIETLRKIGYSGAYVFAFLIKQKMNGSLSWLQYLKAIKYMLRTPKI